MSERVSRRARAGSARAAATLPVAAALLALLAGPLPAATSGRPDRALFYEAKAALGKLQGSDALKQKRSEWEKTVTKFRSVVAKYPQSPAAASAKQRLTQGAKK